MKKNFRFLLVIAIMLGCYLFVGLLSNSVAKAASYEYEGGTITETYSNVEVISFSYDYTSKFKEIDNFYNGYDIKDNGESLRQKSFYSGRAITININHVDEWFIWEKDDDRTVIYKYDFKTEKFDAIMRSFPNQAGTYTLNQDGIYKLEYIFDGSSKYVYYLYINTKMIKSEVSLAGKDPNVPVYSKLTFTLNLEDAYDLNSYSYYYAFGTNVDEAEQLIYSNLNNLFDSTSGKSVTDKKVTIDIKDGDVTLNGEKKYLFIKAVKDNYSTIFHTKQPFEISKDLTVSVFVMDSEGNLVVDKISYFKRNDVIKFRLLFNAPVTFSNLKFGVGPNSVNQNVEDVLEETTVVDVLYVVQDGPNYSILDFDGGFYLKTQNSTKAIVVCNGENATLNVDFKSEYKVDVTAPSIRVQTDSIDGEIKNDYSITVFTRDNNLIKVEYYAKECENYEDNVCNDEFNESVENKGSLDFDVTSDEQTLEIFVSSFGSFNGKNVALFFKATDVVGNKNISVVYPFAIDNVIVDVDDKQSIFIEEDLMDQDTNGVNGKKLLVRVPESYKVSSVAYMFDGETQYECMNVTSDYLLEGVMTFECLSVQDVYLKMNLDIVLVDEYDNEEVYSYYFEYSNLVEESFVIGNYKFDIYTDKEYDMISSDLNNFMGLDANRLVINSADFQIINNRLGLDGATELVVKLVYLNGEEEIVLMDNIVESIQLPSTIEILEKLSDVEEYKLCALKGNDCSLDVYLKYDYNYSYDFANSASPVIIPQKKLVKLSLVDNYLKFEIDNFANNIEVDVNSAYQNLEYKVFDILNTEVDLSGDVTLVQEITYVNNAGESSSATSIDVTKLGTYIVNEYVIAGETSTFLLNYVVNVVDKLAPTIRLADESKIRVMIDEELNIEDVLKDVIVVDNYDTDLEILYSIEPTFDSSKEGEYVISFWTEDSSGNRSMVVSRTVVVSSVQSFRLYLIVGGIIALTIVIMIVGTIVERKKQRKN